MTPRAALLLHSQIPWHHTAAQCSTVQHSETHCNTLHAKNDTKCSAATPTTQYTARHAHFTATHCNILQHTATHCIPSMTPSAALLPHARITLQHTATHCNKHCIPSITISAALLPSSHVTLQNTATYCNTLQHTAYHQFFKSIPSIFSEQRC